MTINYKENPWPYSLLIQSSFSTMHFSLWLTDAGSYHDLSQLKGLARRNRKGGLISVQVWKQGTPKNFYKPNSRSNQWLSGINFRAMAPTVKSFSSSRQEGEDWTCLVNWDIRAKQKKSDCWEIQWNSAFSIKGACHYAGQWYHPLCLNATSDNFRRSQVYSMSKRLPLDYMNISFIQLSFH